LLQKSPADIHVRNDAKRARRHTLNVPAIHLLTIIAHCFTKPAVVRPQYTDSHVLGTLDRQSAALARVPSSWALTRRCTTIYNKK